MSKKLNILVLSNAKHKKQFEVIKKTWEKYFDINATFDKPINIKDYFRKRVDILFIDDSSKFELSYYDKFKGKNVFFSYTVIANKPSEKDVKDLKMLADRIVYTDVLPELLKWSTISVLRKYWDFYSNNSTIIHRNIIADFVENNFTVNKKEVKLTSMETKLLRVFMTNIDVILTKANIFKKVWGYEDADISRNFDQMFFKLKNKIGKENFVVKKNEGIKFI